MPYKGSEKERAGGRRRYERITAERTARGMCPRCGKARPAPDHSLCQCCGEKRRQAERARCAKARAAGILYAGRDAEWTHPGKVEAPYTVCIASASNLTGLVKSSVECRRTGL